MNQKILWKIESLCEQYAANMSFENIFDIQKIKSRYSTDGISLSYPRFCLVDDFDFEQSKKPVFKDAYGEYLGLKRQQLQVIDERPVYLFDNHNEMIFCLHECFESQDKKKPLFVLHIDAHPDDAFFQGGKPKTVGAGNISFFIEQTRISDFFDALSEANIVSGVQRVTDSFSFDDFVLPEQNFVLSLDIDIFGEEGDFVGLEKKIEVIKKTWSRASAIYIAMSPGFINHGAATQLIKLLLNN